MADKVIKGLHVEVDGSVSGLKNAMNEATATMKKTESALKSLNKSIKLDPTSVELYTQKQEVLNKTINETKLALAKLNSIKEEMDNSGVDKTNVEYQKNLELISECKNKLKEYKDQLTTLPASVQAFNAKLEMTARNLDNIANKTAGLSRAFQVLSVASIKQAVSYEENIANIRKVIKDLSDDTVDSLKAIAIETGTSFNQISEYANIGATLGIAEKDIASFTKALVDMQTATNMGISGEEGAKAVARFLNVLGIGQDEAENFGSAITYVGDQFAATADEILEVASNMAGISTIAEVDQYQLIGLAAEMKNLGVRSSSGASAIVRSFNVIENAVVGTTDKNIEKLGALAKSVGMTSQEFKKAWKSNAYETFLKFIDSLSVGAGDATTSLEKLNSQIESGVVSLGEEELEEYTEWVNELAKKGNNAAVTLQTLGLSGVRTAETLLKLAGNSATVREAVTDANKAWQENTALQDKANTVYGTTKYQVESFLESLKQVGAELGEAFLPSISKVVDIAKSLNEALKNANPNVKNLITSFITFNALLSPTMKMTSMLFSGTTSIVKGIDTLNKKIRGTGGSIDDILKGGTLLIKQEKGIEGTTLRVATAQEKATVSANKLTGVRNASLVALGALATALTIYGIKEAYANDYVNKNTKALQDNKKAADDLYLSNVISTTLEERRAGLNANFFSELEKNLEIYNNAKKGTDEYKEAEEKLNEQIATYNSLSPETQLTLDTEAKKIVNQKDEVINLKDAYQQYLDEKRKTLWLEAHEEEYLEAIKKRDEAVKGLVENQNSLNELTEKYGEGAVSAYIDFLESGGDWATLNESPFLNQVKELMQDVDSSKLIGIKDNLKDYSTIYGEANNIVETFNKIETAPLEEANKMISALTTGVKIDITSTEATKQSIQDIEEAIKIAKDLQENGIDTSSYLEGLETERKTLFDVYGEQRAQQELDIAATKNYLTDTIDEIDAYSGAAALRIGSDFETAVQTASYNNQLYLDENPLIQKVILQYVDEDGNGISSYYGRSGGSGGYGDSVNKSGGFGIFNSIFDSIGRTLTQSNKIHTPQNIKSGGFNNLTSNLTITVNTNQTITESTVRGWANIINEELGGMVNV